MDNGRCDVSSGRWYVTGLLFLEALEPPLEERAVEVAIVCDGPIGNDSAARSSLRGFRECPKTKQRKTNSIENVDGCWHNDSGCSSDAADRCLATVQNNVGL